LVSQTLHRFHRYGLANDEALVIEAVNVLAAENGVDVTDRKWNAVLVRVVKWQIENFDPTFIGTGTGKGRCFFDLVSDGVRAGQVIKQQAKKLGVDLTGMNLNQVVITLLTVAKDIHVLPTDKKKDENGNVIYVARPYAAVDAVPVAAIKGMHRALAKEVNGSTVKNHIDLLIRLKLIEIVGGASHGNGNSYCRRFKLAARLYEALPFIRGLSQCVQTKVGQDNDSAPKCDKVAPESGMGGGQMIVPAISISKTGYRVQPMATVPTSTPVDVLLGGQKWLSNEELAEKMGLAAH
jgi:hypothetical protein